MNNPIPDRLNEVQVNALVSKYRLVWEGRTSDGVSWEEFVRHLLLTPEFYAFMRAASRIPTAYAEDTQEIIEKVVAKTLPYMISVQNVNEGSLLV